MTRRGLFAVLAGLGFALAGCGGSTHTPSVSATPLASTTYRLRITPADRATLGGASVRRLPLFVSRGRLALATWGSSNCLNVPGKLSVLGPDAIRVDLVAGSWRPSGAWLRYRADDRTTRGMRIVASRLGGCLQDLRETPMVVSLPRQINVNARLTIHLYYPLATKAVVLHAPPSHTYPPAA
ncbi:MAG TPA: hypothetical protein VMU72_01400 [Gaiellaceae bacterium]|nr:hypothetical protein [Gaiellaceae bacterium]